MPDFKYKALDARGKSVSGVLNAVDEMDLHTRLRLDNKYLLSAAEQTAKRRRRVLGAMILCDFSRQVGMLISSGVSLVRALGIISQEETLKPYQRAVYEDVLRLVRQGVALSDALEEQGGCFPPLMVNMYRAAETSGTLDKTALRMAIHYEKEYRLNTKIKSSMTYPKILAGLIVVVVTIIMGYVLPQFESMFDMMEEIPASTRFLMGLSDLVATKGLYLGIGIVLFVLLIRFLLNVPSVKMFMDKLRLYLPIIGKLQRTICTARFAGTLSSLYAAGIPIVTALQIARKTVGNQYINAQFDEVIPYVRAGANLSEGLATVDGFVRKLATAIRVGEETGSLDTMLDSISNALEYDAEMAINKMVSYVEPIMIIVMATIVGFIMISVIKPIYGSYAAIDSYYSN